MDNYISGSIHTHAGDVLRVTETLSLTDHIGAVKVRWGINRNNYRVNPGIYIIGSPDDKSDVFISANYKLSFDTLRKNLTGLNAWILVLDTEGINVWCAAGKGTFGTKELVRRIGLTNIEKIISHKYLIAPQLGASGISAHRVEEQTGFKIRFGPVRCSDIKKYISAGYKATPEMRKVNFRFTDRLKLIPVELVFGRYYLLTVLAIFFILADLNKGGYSVDLAWTTGGRAVVNILVAYFSGTTLTPMFLSMIPGRSFAFKGFLTGMLVSIMLSILGCTGSSLIERISWILIVTAISSFLSMNFTGASTFTSLSGVKKEMKIAMPLQIISAGLGCIMWMLSLFYMP
ncbi:MAG: acetyl-CoA synthase subunit gamma [Ignavibacteriales bacterium]|nr:acetyl-CoA synthase subunit gamma [Ignavibacteriales bacterium]